MNPGDRDSDCVVTRQVMRRSGAGVGGARAQFRRGGRVAEGAALEMPCTGNCTVGSNPTPSAISQMSLTLQAGEKGPAEGPLSPACAAWPC